jgi:chaperonin GroEL (HSP60 family)
MHVSISTTCHDVPTPPPHFPLLFHPQVVSEDLGLKLEKVELEMLGQCKKATVSKDDTVLLHGAGGKEMIQVREGVEGLGEREVHWVRTNGFRTLFWS